VRNRERFWLPLDILTNSDREDTYIVATLLPYVTGRVADHRNLALRKIRSSSVVSSGNEPSLDFSSLLLCFWSLLAFFISFHIRSACPSLAPCSGFVEKLAAQFEQKGLRAQTRENNLPIGANRDEAIYRPDVIVRNRENEIVWLVEVETSEGGKAVAGAAILADICMEKMNVQNKPKVLFVFYRSGSNLELAEKRLKPLRQKATHIEIPPPVTEEAVTELISAFSEQQGT